MPYPKLIPEFKEKWLIALRSGDYQQTKGWLRKSGERDGFCCLGVACDILDSGLWIIGGNYSNPQVQHWKDKDCLPPRFATKQMFVGGYSFIETDPDDDGYRQGEDEEDHDAYTKLSNMNDHGSTFAEIADWIEVNL